MVGRASVGELHVQGAKAGADAGIHEDLARAQARVAQLENELRKMHEALKHAKSGAEGAVRHVQSLELARVTSDALGERVLAEHTVVFERARANAAEASARQAVEAALRLKRERDEARDALRECQQRLLEAETALKRC